MKARFLLRRGDQPRRGFPRRGLAVLTAGCMAVLALCPPNVAAQHGHPPTDDEVENSDMTFLLEEAETFNPLSVDLAFAAVGGTISKNPADVFIDLNGTARSPLLSAFTPHGIAFSLQLQSGRNTIRVGTADEDGMLVHGRYTLWAGTQTLPVRVVDEAGKPVSAADVTVRLADDPSVSVRRSAAGATLTFDHLPARTVILTARAGGGRYGTAGAVALGEEVVVRVTPIQEPSPVDNNDFSRGLDGWRVGDAAASLAPHQETYAPLPPAPEACPPSDSPLTASPILPRTESALPRAGGAAPMTQDGSGDQDLVIETDGDLPQTVSRTFETTPGVSAVRVRFRFVTREVPAGYFGSEYNDYSGTHSD